MKWLTSRLSPVLLIALLSGCGTSPPTRFFVLEPVPPKTPPPRTAQAQGPPIIVGSVDIPSTLDRPEMVRRIGENQLDIRGLDHWGAPFGTMVHDVLVQDLAARLPRGVIDVATQPGDSQTERGLSVDIGRFSSDATGTVTLDAHWTVLSGRDRKPGREHHETIRVSGFAPDPAGGAAGMSQALGELADRIARAILAGKG